jgi:predicted lactoylglutathione lyase
MIAHISLMVKDYTKSRNFYARALLPLGYKLSVKYPKFKSAGYMAHGSTDFWISEQKNPTPTHIAFLAKNKKAVNEFYTAALKAGGKDNGAPGYRKNYSPGYYASFIYDPNGNNIEAVWFDQKIKK